MQQEINSFNSDDLSSSSQHGGLSAATRVNIQFILNFILINYSQQVVNTIMFETKFQIAVVQNSDNYPLRNHCPQDNRSGFPHTCLPDSDLLCVLLTIAYLDIQSLMQNALLKCYRSFPMCLPQSLRLKARLSAK